MKAISLFSGVGGFDLGFERAGIETVLQAERDPHCLKVVERHWPQVRRVTDVRCVGEGWAARVPHGEMGGADSGPDAQRLRHERSANQGADLIFGGFPCQDLSVAGKRAGLGGERSGLWFEFHRVLSELRPRWTVIENVPGLLSSNEGRDFGILLDGLGELGYGVAWAVLDAQHFGVPQRRRRVFIVGCLGDERRAAAVLSVCESCGGNPETGRAPGERVAATVRGRSAGPGVNIPGRGGEDDDNLIFAIQDGREIEKDQNGLGISRDIAYTLDGTGAQAIASPLTASAGHHGHSSPRGDGSDNLVPTLAKAVRTMSGGIDRENMHTLIPFDHDTYIPAVVASVTAKWAKGSGGPAGDEIQDLVYAPSTLSTLAGGAHPGGLNGQEAESQSVVMRQGVRRLTPLECERLQGFPDGWTEGQSDSHRYRQMGNAVCVPVAEWIGHRLMAV